MIIHRVIPQRATDPIMTTGPLQFGENAPGIYVSHDLSVEWGDFLAIESERLRHSKNPQDQLLAGFLRAVSHTLGLCKQEAPHDAAPSR